MIENRPWLTIFSHTMLILGIAVILFPLYVAFVAATLDKQAVYAAPMTLIPGTHLLENIHNIWVNGVGTNSAPFWRMLLNSFVMAFSITLGKITVSMLSAFAIVWFRFPLRNLFFWMIFITLMLPVEVRIFPTVEVIANLQMLDSYAGLTLPLMASATATFLFRQFFMTLPDELVEAARIDGASPMRFFCDIVFPLSKTNLAALIDAPLAVDAQTPLSELLSHVGQAPCAVPVVDEDQQYVGIISKGMLLRALDREGVNNG